MAAPAGRRRHAHVTADLGELELSCEHTATTLLLRRSRRRDEERRSGDFHVVLTETFVKLISDNPVGRLGAPDGRPSW